MFARGICADRYLSGTAGRACRRRCLHHPRNDTLQRASFATKQEELEAVAYRLDLTQVDTVDVAPPWTYGGDCPRPRTVDVGDVAHRHLKDGYMWLFLRLCLGQHFAVGGIVRGRVAQALESCEELPHRRLEFAPCWLQVLHGREAQR